MIIGFVGTPGSGKSYEAVKKILDNIKLGRKVYTNIEGLDNPKCRKYIQSYCNITDFQLETCLIHLTDEEATWPDLHCEPGSLILLDEVHKNLSNRDWQSEKNVNFAKWASTHRHDGYDLVLITQSLDKVDKHVRSLIEWSYLFRKVNMFGAALQKKYVCYAYAGDDHNGKAMSKSVRTYDPKIFPAYQSYSNEVVKEIGFMKHVNIFKHPVFYSIPLVLGVSIYFFSQSSLIRGELYDVGLSEAVASEIEPPKKTVAKKEPKRSADPPSTIYVDETVYQYEEKQEIELQGSPKISVFKKRDGTVIYTNTGQPPLTKFVKVL